MLCYSSKQCCDFCSKPKPKGPSSGDAVHPYLVGTVTVCLATQDRKWGARGVGLLAPQNSLTGAKGEHGLWEDSGPNLPLGS